MAESPFAFYRGAARIMAMDLAAVPHSDLTVQLCGDAHLANFGVYASPGRRLVFDLNDFDETLPGPFEWDVKRLAASFVIAGQHRRFDNETCRQLAIDLTEAYRTTMAGYAQQGWLEMWHSRSNVADLVESAISRGASKDAIKGAKKLMKKAKSKDHLRAAGKLVERIDGVHRFRSQPPLLVPFRDLPTAIHPDEIQHQIDQAFSAYRSSLDDRMRWLLDRYEQVDFALKVVGVGSVGTRCFVALLLGHTPRDVLLLQVKEATNSVLEEHLPATKYENHGRRVVEGQRLMQAASDIFLGWSSSLEGHDFYWRQLKDWKASVDLERASLGRFAEYARLCGAVLARAHAVSGHPGEIAGYLGSGAVFDTGIGEFAVRYAEQNLVDHAGYVAAIEEGRLEAAELHE